MGNTNSRFICQICNKFLRNPVILSCECNICHEHLDKLFSREKEILFQCKNCKTKTKNKKSDLKENQDLNLELEQNLHLNEDFRKLKEKLNVKLEEIKLTETEFSIKTYEHFYSIKNDIDIKRETFLLSLNKADLDCEKIRRQSENLIKKTEIAEEMFRKNFQKQFNLFFNASQNQMTDAFRDPSLTKKQVDRLNVYYTPFSISSFDTRLKNNKFIESKLCDGVKDFQLGELFLDDLDEK